VLHCLELLRSSFAGKLQLLAIFGMMKNHQSNPQNVKVRMAQVEYLALLLPKLDGETIRSITGTPDMVAALERIALFCAEPKSANLRRVSIHVVLDLYEMDAEALAGSIRAMSIEGSVRISSRSFHRAVSCPSFLFLFAPSFRIFSSSFSRSCSGIGCSGFEGGGAPPLLQQTNLVLAQSSFGCGCIDRPLLIVMPPLNV
jgi:hypothetical protein